MAKQYRYGSVPMVYHSRSKFDLSYSHKTTGNVGQLLPLYLQEVYPGDSFKCDANVVARCTSSFLKPVMDNLFLDVMFFFVPSRTVFSDWAEIFGENNDSPWARPSSVSAPKLAVGTGVQDVSSKMLAAYLGLPVGSQSSTLSSLGGVSVLPFRAYAKVYNEWYRDENLVDPVNLQTGSTVDTEMLNADEFGPDNYTGLPAKVSKLHDYFTQLLPSPQKGDAVPIGTSVFPQSSIPVTTTNTPVVTGVRSALSFTSANGSTDSSGSYPLVINGGSLFPLAASSSSTIGSFGLYPDNLVANIGETVLGSVSVNDLRYAFQIQKILEADATFGTRYTEFLQGHFGVTSPDARLQRSEFLGGRRIPLNVIQTVQTSESTSSSPLGNVGAWSLSNGRSGYTKGFTEHGFVIGMFCIRQFHTYQQGTEKFWWRSNRYDFLDPLLTTIGFQPVFTKELASITGVDSDTVFGYAPAFEDLRCRQNRVSGMLASESGDGLDIWHFADYYQSAPVLGQSWIEELPNYVDRTLSVPSRIVDQFIFDVYFKQYAIRVMPTYGMPGLIDHH